jgi:hypothetical protein
VPRHLLLFQPPAHITSGFSTFSFSSGVGLLAPRPTPNLEDQVSEFISPRDRVAQLVMWGGKFSIENFPVRKIFRNIFPENFPFLKIIT